MLNTAFGWATIAVDTHIFRVCNRTHFAPGKNVDQVEEKLLKVVPAEFKVDCHHWLILHGRYTCIARKPRCGSTLSKTCASIKKRFIRSPEFVGCGKPYPTAPFPRQRLFLSEM